VTALDTRPEWLAARSRGIGASDAPAIVGLSPYRSALSLYLEKTGEYVPDDEPTEAMEWGIRLEPVVAAAWAEKNGKTLHRYAAYDPASVHVHPDIPWMLASLDGFVIADNSHLDFTDTDDEQRLAVYEGKTASGWIAALWDGDEPPAHVIVQVQWQLAVTGLDRGEVACLIGGQRFVQYTVHRDDSLIDALIDAGEQFWLRVMDRNPPAADGHQATTDALKARWQESVDDAVELGTEGVELVQRRHRAKKAADVASEEQAECENRLRVLLGENVMGTCFGEIACTWKPTKTGIRRLIVREIV
jgi:putative phage-type endonuclease